MIRIADNFLEKNLHIVCLPQTWCGGLGWRSRVADPGW